MRSPDTHPDAHRAQLDLFRRASPARRAALALSLSRTTLQLAHRAIQQAHPDATDDELRVLYIAHVYGPALAEQLRQHLLLRRQLPPPPA